MERFNPFAAAEISDEPFGSRSSDTTELSGVGTSPRRAMAGRTDSLGAVRRTPATSPASGAAAAAASRYSSLYTTSFPDPFGEPSGATGSEGLNRQSAVSEGNVGGGASGRPAARSSSVAFAENLEESIPAAPSSTPRPTRGQTSGLGSFLSRATSVTSSSVTDRVSEAVGSVRSAVDSISSQIQQAVPLTSSTEASDEQQQQQQSAASYLASKLSSATNQLTNNLSSSSQTNSSSLPIISRQRIVLIVDSSQSGIEWSQQFTNYRRLIAGLGPIGTSSQSALSNFINSATAQLTSSVGSSSFPGAGEDLVEQADASCISVLANQSSSTAIVLISSSSSAPTGSTQARQVPTPVSGRASGISSASGARIIRPEYVVFRQRCGKRGDAPSEHLRGLVTAFNYCLVPMFEPLDVWTTFQDRQLVFARLLRIQRLLGKDKFPLIPQVFCQTHNDLLNHVNSSNVSLPCLVRTGQLGKGRMRADNLQMLKDFASIVAISGLSCTVEPYLEVKCDLIIQKLGTSLKLFKRQVAPTGATDQAVEEATTGSGSRQSAARQTSLSSQVLSSLIPNSSTGGSALSSSLAGQQQNNMTSASTGSFERMSEIISSRYRGWVEAIAREFDNKLEAFCLKVVVTREDREYIVGLSNCSMDFLGPQDQQEEDKRSFVELIISNMNTLLPKHSPISREPSANLANMLNSSGGASYGAQSTTTFRRSSSDDKATSASGSGPGAGLQPGRGETLGDKKKFISQSQINGGRAGGRGGGGGARHYGQLSSRSQSVSVGNQSDYMEDQPIGKSSYFTRRGSDRSDSVGNDTTDDGTSTADSAAALANHQRQASLGQSFLDQTSTAFSSFHKQSMSFFKRLDARAPGELGSTPPMSAKSDKNFDRGFPLDPAMTANEQQQQVSKSSKDFKSQSVDCSASADTTTGGARSGRRAVPPKPPPPQSLGSRQSSLASYSSQQRPSSTATPRSTPSQTRQNTLSDLSAEPPPTGTGTGNAAAGQQKSKSMVRQNSALSAFEPFDSDLRGARQEARKESLDRSASMMDNRTTGQQVNSSVGAAGQLKRANQYDSASITSGDSNSTSETTTAEDTMNNLKKTFASIFGDKCE